MSRFELLPSNPDRDDPNTPSQHILALGEEDYDAWLDTLRSRLQPRQARFAEEYARNGGNGLQAALSAGYSTPESQPDGEGDPLSGARTQAVRLLANANVVAYLTALTAPSRNQRILSAQDLAERLSSIVDGTLIAPIVTKDGMVDTEPTHADRVRAAETLAKIRGYLAPVKVDVTVEIRDGALAWMGGVLNLLQERLQLEDSEIEALLPLLPPLRVGGRQTIRVIDAE